MSEDTVFIRPIERLLSIDGCDVVIAPLVMRDLPKLLEVAAPLVRGLAMFSEGALDRFKSGQATEADVGALTGALAAGADDIFAAIALCSRQPVDWVAGLLPDRFAALAAECIEVNRDFFTRALPALRAIGARLVPSATQTPSSSS